MINVYNYDCDCDCDTDTDNDSDSGSNNDDDDDYDYDNNKYLSETLTHFSFVIHGYFERIHTTKWINE